MKTKLWKDENGLEIPVSRVTKSEKLRERKANQLIKKALNLNERLTAFKELTNSICEEVFKALLAEHNVKADSKGNFTWYNFDRSIKIEVSQKGRIDFDETLIAVAKEKFDTFLEGATGGVDQMIKAIIMDAFQTSRGRLDPKRVMKLVEHRKRVDKKKYPLFHEATELIEDAIRRPESRQYVRMWQKDSKGEYQAIILNFSSI